MTKAVEKDTKDIEKKWALSFAWLFIFVTFCFITMKSFFFYAVVIFFATWGQQTVRYCYIMALYESIVEKNTKQH